MSNNQKIRRSWAVYCEDGVLWAGGMRKELAQIEVHYANAECDGCAGTHTLVLETETGVAEPEAKTA